jgi:hypothetical protein
MASEEGLQECPSCKKWIPLSARLCRHCGEIIEDAQAERPEARPRRSSGIQKEMGPPPLRRAYRREEEEEADEEPRRRRRSRRSRQGDYADCPHCGCPGFAERVSFTWWGGLIGPAMLNHVRCKECGACYNGTTGRDNTTGIVIYTVVGFGIGLALLIFFLMLGHAF